VNGSLPPSPSRSFLSYPDNRSKPFPGPLPLRASIILSPIILRNIMQHVRLAAETPKIRGLASEAMSVLTSRRHRCNERDRQTRRYVTRSPRSNASQQVYAVHVTRSPRLAVPPSRARRRRRRRRSRAAAGRYRNCKSPGSREAAARNRAPGCSSSAGRRRLSMLLTRTGLCVCRVNVDGRLLTLRLV